MDSDKNQGRIQSVVRASDILKCFYDSRELGLLEIARMVGLNKSTAYGLVSTLVACGFLQQDPVSGKYSVGVESFRLGQCFKLDVIKYIRPYLSSLSEEFHETVNYLVRDGADVIYLEKVESAMSVRISTYRGQRRPMYCNGAGKAIWAFLPPAEQDAVMDMTSFEKITENTITDRAAMLAELSTVRERGYAVDNEEAEYGLYCIAVPLTDRSGKPIGALSLSGPKMRMTQELERRIISRLMECSGEISRSISFAR